MKAIILNAFYLLKINFITTLSLSVFYSIIAIFAPFTSSGLMYFVLFFSITQFISYLLLLEKSNSILTLLTLPQNRKVIARSYYVIGLIFIIIGVLPMICSLVSMAINNSETLISNLSMAIITFCIYTIIAFVLTPYVLKFGVSKAPLLVIIIYVPVGILTFVPISFNEIFIFIESISSLIPTILILVTLIVFFVSVKISEKIMINREF